MEFLVISVTVLYFGVAFTFLVQFSKWGLTQFANSTFSTTKSVYHWYCCWKVPYVTKEFKDGLNMFAKGLPLV